jgi:hypothetical protein
MVQRTSQEVNFTPNQTASVVPQYAGGSSSPNVAEKYTLDQRSGENSKLIQSIIGTAQPLLEKGFKGMQEDAYMRGATAAATGKSEEELESNFMTRDWTVGGYRDVSGKLKIAQSEAKLAIDMKRLREQSPEKMQEYLNTRRDELSPIVEGMTRHERVNTFGKLLLADQHAIAMHSTEHTKFIIDRTLQPLRLDNDAAQTNLDVGQRSGNAEQYDKAQLLHIGHLASVTNSGLDKPLQENHIVDSLSQAMANGHVNSYEYARGKEVTLPDGTKARTPNIIGMLSTDAQQKLSAAHYGAMQKVDGARLFDLNNEISHVKAAISRGDYQGGENGVVELMKRATLLNPSGNYMPIMDHFLTEGVKNKNSVGIQLSWASGDKAKLAELGGTDESGLEATVKEWTKQGTDIEVRQKNLNEITLKGSHAAASYVGKIVGGIVDEVMLSEKGALPGKSATMLKNQFDAITLLEQQEKLGARDAILAGMPLKTRVDFERLRANATASQGNVQGALVHVQAMRKRDDSMNTWDKAAEELATKKEHDDFNAGTGAAGSVMGFLRGLPWVGNPDKADMSPRTSWWSAQTDNPKVLDAIQDQTRTTFSRAYDAIRKVDNSSSPETVAGMARAELHGRTVSTPDGPLFVPAGKTPATYFGGNLTKEQYGVALSRTLPKHNESNRFVYEESNGRIQAQEYDKTGAKIGGAQWIDPADVQAQGMKDVDAKKKLFGEAHVTGRRVTIGGQDFNIDGKNTASFSPEVMLEGRMALVKFEGHDAVPKPDISGKLDSKGKPVMVTGVGVTSQNTHYPGEGASTTQHVDSFLKASDEAARNASRFTQAIGRTSPAMQQLAMEVMYQSGAGTVAGGKNSAGGVLSAHPAYTAFFQNRDPAKAQVLMKETPAYKYSADPKRPDVMTGRQRHYLELAQRAVPRSNVPQ